MRFLTSLGISGGALALALAATAPALASEDQVAPVAEPSADDIAAVARYALPLALSGFADKCAGALSNEGYFATDGAALESKLVENAVGAFALARGAMFSLLSRGEGFDGDVMADLPPEAVEAFAAALIPNAVADEIAPESCAEIERALELLDPLPAENIAQLLGFVISRAGKNENGEASAE